MNLKTTRFLVPFLALALLGQGCLSSSSSTAAGPDGGVFRSTDLMEWKQLKTFNSGDKIGSIADVGTVSVATDPSDTSAIYLGTMVNGLLYTLDGGVTWQGVKQLNLNTGRVLSVAVDPKDKCTVYATRANQVLKTQTCLRDWAQVYFDPRTDKAFTAIAVDHYNSQVVYAATSDGDILRSEDGGTSWRSVYRVDGVQINGLVIDPKDSRVILAATAGSGIAKSSDGGSSWTLIYKPLQEFDGARRVTKVYADPNETGRFYAISKYGIVRSDDSGETWTALQLPTPPGSIEIKAMAIHPTDSNKLVYATATSIVSSEDGGQTWTPKKLPTKRGVSFLTYTNDAQPALLLGAPPAGK